MSRNEELIALRRAALAEPTVAQIGSDGHTLVVSFDGEVYAYRGPDFSRMTTDEIDAFIARMDQ